jgi:nucleoside-diphosphate-sugar epimerase
MRILVTGASGFVGHALCASLAERRHDVSALVGREGSQPPKTRPLSGDLGDSARLAALLEAERPDCIVHLAAEIASQRSERKLREVNVDGTARLLAACASLTGGEPQAGPRIVFASTVVTGDAHGALLSEDRALPVQTPYGRTKQEGERLVLESGLPAVILRPSHVYGPGGWYVDELIAQLRRPGRFAVIGSGANLWDVVHVDDVAAAFVLAIERAPVGSTYHVVDDAPITFYEFMTLTARELALAPPRRTPAVLASLVAGRNAVAAAMRSARSSNEKIKRELGWMPRFPTARAGVPDAIARLTATR